jgi:hypothetical protein
MCGGPTRPGQSRVISATHLATVSTYSIPGTIMPRRVRRGSIGRARSRDRQHHPAHRDGHQLIALDADLPPPTTMSGHDGLDELSMVNQGVGILIDQGHYPQQGPCRAPPTGR